MHQELFRERKEKNHKSLNLLTYLQSVYHALFPPYISYPFVVIATESKYGLMSPKYIVDILL